MFRQPFVPGKLFALFLPGIVLLAILAVPALAANDALLQSRAFGTIFGSPPSDWTIGNYYGGAESTLTEVKGKPVLQIGASALRATRLSKIPADSELTLRFRLNTTLARGASLTVTPDLKSPDDPGGKSLLTLSLSVQPGAEQETVTWSLPALPGQKYGAYGYYTLRTLPQARLLFPDAVRARVEEDYAALDSLQQRWLTIRYVVRRNDVQVYLDGRLLEQAGGPDIDGAGYLRMSLFEGVQLDSVTVKPLPVRDARFQTVDLSAYLNGARFAGRTLAADAPPRGSAITVGSVPFLLPSPDARGNDHLDLGRSWARFGPIEGYHDPWEGDNARWRGALYREGGRIQLRVPNGNYRALHLLAAFAGAPDTTAVVTAQFYRPTMGHPVNFAGRVPLFSARASASAALPLRLADGTAGYLHRVSIPLEPEGLAAFADLPYLEVELTKETTVYRSFPDPTYYSIHPAGLPSGVHVYGVTLERPPVEVTLTPDHYAHLWTAPETPSYTVTMVNPGTAPQRVRFTLTTKSYDGRETTTRAYATRVPGGSQASVKLPIALTRYGIHDLTLRVEDAGGARLQTSSLAYLHPDTRERGNWEEGRGPIFGFWDWNGAHGTPSGIPRLEMMYRAGAESSMALMNYASDEEKQYLADHQMMTRFLAYQLSMTKAVLGVDWDPSKPEEMGKALIESLKKNPYVQPSAVNKPELAVFFAEPLLGPVSYMSRPENFGEPEHVMTADEQKAYKNILDQFVIAATAIKKEWPNARCFLPWGLPAFPVEFLKYSKEATALMEGPAIDIVQFERMPEMQLDQVTFASVLWQLKEQWKKSAGKPWPHLISIEGTSVSPAKPGALTKQEEAELFIRGELLLTAFGTTQLLGMPTPAACSGAWGETHYGGGMCERIPLLNPKPMYAAFATLTRQLNRMNYVKMIPAGSTSVFCLQYRHYKTGKLLHVFWTLRGTRPVTLTVPAGAGLELYDQMDNSTALREKDGAVSFTIGTSPCYLWGLDGDAKVASLGQPDHADAAPAGTRSVLAQPGDGSWSLSAERDADYENCHPEFITKFPGTFTIAPAAAPAAQGRRALAVHLGPQEKERKVMPFYTTLKPRAPIVIPGKPSALGLWVNAASDWGRVVYCLRDAKGERWISVGKKDDWNVDDVHNWSRFCFDGWRYLRFEMPGNAPYDIFREAGTSFWGYYGDGDQVVDLPLTLEKIIVERRTHVIQVDEVIPANPRDVLLGDLYAEYARPADTGAEAVRLSRLRMETGGTTLTATNPIAGMAAGGTGAAPAITGVTAPEREYDGRRCLVFFTAVPEAKTYDIWVSRHADGRNALRLGAGWTAPGQLLTGLYANTDQYLFLVATRADGTATPPSPPFKVNLKDMFPMK